MRFKWYDGISHRACLWWCPGCREAHQVTVGDLGWAMTGTDDAPTFSPSILTKTGKRCHSYMEGGKMRFLKDCDHDLKGQTVEVGELPRECYE